MTRFDRVAASECVRIMALLAEADSPHSKELAMLISGRLLTIVEEGAGKSLSDQQIRPWLDIGSQLLTDTGAATS